jgi:hypothetical protein
MKNLERANARNSTEFRGIVRARQSCAVANNSLIKLILKLKIDLFIVAVAFIYVCGGEDSHKCFTHLSNLIHDINEGAHLLGCDRRYAMPLATTLRSIVDTDRSGEPFEFHVLVDGLSERIRRRIPRSQTAPLSVLDNPE